MGLKSRRKGKVGELDLVHWLAKYEIHAERGAQHRGGPGSPDVEIPDWPWLHIEVKRTETIEMGSAELDLAMLQSESDAGERQLPVVFWRRSRRPWALSFWLRGYLEDIVSETAVASWAGGARWLVTIVGEEAIAWLRDEAERRKI
jgi:hypothetical protein